MLQRAALPGEQLCHWVYEEGVEGGVVGGGGRDFKGGRGNRGMEDEGGGLDRGVYVRL